MATPSKQKVDIKIMAEKARTLIERDPAKAIKLGQKVHDLALKENNKDGIGRSLMVLGMAYIRCSEYDKAIPSLQESLRIYQELENDLGCIRVSNSLGQAYLFAGLNDKVLECYQYSIDYARRIGNTEMIAVNLMCIATLYFTFDDFEEAVRYNLRAYRCAKRIDFTPCIAYVLHGLSMAYMHLKEYQKAMNICRKSLDLKADLNDKHSYAVTIAALGKIHYELGEYDKALDCYSKTLATYKKHGDKRGQAFMLASQAEAFSKTGDYNKAVELLADAITIGEAVGSHDNLYQFYDVISTAYAKKRNYRQAYQYRLLYEDAKEKLLDAKTQKKIATLELSAQLARVEHEKQLLQKENEIKALKQQQLQDEIESKNEELARLALEFVKKAELIKSINHQLGTTSGVPENTTRAIKHAIKETLIPERDWQIFYTQLQQANSGFFAVLSKKYPELSATELKICSMLKLNLQSKEISEILAISQRTVENHRNRIRKKFGLLPHNSLSAFLSQFHNILQPG